VTKLCWQRQLTSIVLMLSFSCVALGVDSPGASGAVLHASGKVQVEVTRSQARLWLSSAVRRALPCRHPDRREQPEEKVREFFRG